MPRWKFEEKVRNNQQVDQLTAEAIGIKTLAGTEVWYTDNTGVIVGPTISAPVITGAATFSGDPVFTGVPQGIVKSEVLTFTEAVQAGAGTYTGTVTLPAGAVLNNIQVVTTVLWDDATSASLDVGDTADPDGWFATVNVKATDLLVGEVLDISNAENWGATQGVYLVAASGRKGIATGGSGVYYPTAETVKATIAVGAGGGSAGRTRVIVTYSIPEVTAATFA